jgi:hypothetical protein
MARRLTAPRRRRTTDDDLALIPVWAQFACPDREGDWQRHFLVDRGEPLGDPRLTAILALHLGETDTPTISREDCQFYAFPRVELPERIEAALAAFHRRDLLDDAYAPQWLTWRPNDKHAKTAL